MRGRAAVVAILVMLGAGPAAAQTVDDIVARHIEARGGYAALKGVQTVRFTRTVVTPFTTLRVIVHRKRPGSYRVEQTGVTQGGPVVGRGVFGDTAWDVGPDGKAVPRTAAAAVDMRELEADFDGLLVDWKAKGHAVALAGREKLPSGDTYKLTVKTPGGAERTIYLDATTFLERRQTGTLNLPGGRQFSVVVDLDNHREVGGVRFPHDISEERTGQEPVQSLVTYTEQIEVNVPIEDALFAPPSAR